MITKEERGCHPERERGIWVAASFALPPRSLASLGMTPGAAFIACLVTGLPWRSAAAVGVLMNTRGLMELVILNIGLDVGVISPPIFTMMVLMALVTTVATSPLLRLLIPNPDSS